MLSSQRTGRGRPAHFIRSIEPVSSIFFKTLFSPLREKFLAPQCLFSRNNFTATLSFLVKAVLATSKQWCHSDVALRETLHGKGSTYGGNSGSILGNIISWVGQKIFVQINFILTKLCPRKLRVPVIMTHRVHYMQRMFNYFISATLQLLKVCVHHKNSTTQYNYKGKLECGPMPNVMAALPNIDGALCSTPQSLADAHYYSAVQ